MPTKQITPFVPRTQAQWINAVRKNASSEFQNRIPAATKANFQDSAKKILEYGPARNEFLNALINQVGRVIARNMSFTNPLGKFKVGMLEYGDTIEEIFVGLLEAKEYSADRDSLERDVFGQERPDVQASYHKVNRQNKYKVTINDAMIRRAFFEQGGFNDLVTKILAASNTSDEYDEFLMTVALFKEYEDNGGFFKVKVPNVSAYGSTEAQAKELLRAIRGMAATLPFPSRLYNAAGMYMTADPDELELFITPTALAAIDVEALAAAFNVERADFNMRVTVIPENLFGIEGVQAILTTRDFFVIADTVYETRNIQNPDGLYENYWLHHHQIISFSRFVPAVMFWTGEGTVITEEEFEVENVVLTVVDRDGDVVAEVERGQNYLAVGIATTNPDGGPNDATRLVLEGANSQFTYVNQAYGLYIGSDETAETLTLRAIATDDNTVTATYTLAVTGDRVRLWPNPAVIESDPPITDPGTSSFASVEGEPSDDGNTPETPETPETTETPDKAETQDKAKSDKASK